MKNTLVVGAEGADTFRGAVHIFHKKRRYMDRECKNSEWQQCGQR